MKTERELLAHTISLGDDTDVSEWDDCLLMADRIVAAGWTISAPKATIAEALEEALDALVERKIIAARKIIERVVTELRGALQPDGWK